MSQKNPKQRRRSSMFGNIFNRKAKAAKAAEKGQPQSKQAKQEAVATQPQESAARSQIEQLKLLASPKEVYPDEVSLVFTMPRKIAKDMLIDIQNRAEFLVRLGDTEVKAITNCIMNNEQEVELAYGRT
jgi:hypothetical protein